LAQKREAIAAAGTQLAFVHPSTEDKASALFARYGVGEVPRIADAGASLYAAFGLQRAKPGQYLSWQALRRLWGAWRKGYRVGKPAGDTLLMPGVFLLRGSEILRSFRHRDVSDQPDYLSLAQL
jgi:AhpC/TSA antioxidant enzyme